MANASVSRNWQNIASETNILDTLYSNFNATHSWHTCLWSIQNSKSELKTCFPFTTTTVYPLILVGMHAIDLYTCVLSSNSVCIECFLLAIYSFTLRPLFIIFIPLNFLNVPVFFLLFSSYAILFLQLATLCKSDRPLWVGFQTHTRKKNNIWMEHNVFKNNYRSWNRQQKILIQMDIATPNKWPSKCKKSPFSICACIFFFFFGFFHS